MTTTLTPRQKVAQWVDGRFVVNAITILILINAVTLGLETNPAAIAKYGSLLRTIDLIILAIFTIEVGLKLYAHRLDFFKSGWNIFDFLIVAIAWVPANEAFSILRTMRILRVLRLLSVVPQMRRVITAIGKSIPGMLSVIGVLGLLFYVSAVLTTKLFGQHANAEMQEWFGTIGASAYTLFQIMTLESWSMGIVRPVMTHYPLAWIFFVPFIIITSFAVLNLFIGIIVDAMQTVQEGNEDEDVSAAKPPLTDDQLHAKLDLLNKAVQDLTHQISSRSSSRP